MNLTLGARISVKQCMNIQPNESVLIITDKNMPREIGGILLKASQEITNNTQIKFMEPLERNGQEPNQEIAELMKTSDVLFLPTSKSLTHTKARRDASNQGVRIASMPGVLKLSFTQGGLTADYNQVKENCEKMFNKIKDCSSFHIYSENGTDLQMNITKYGWFLDDGIYHKKGQCGNLPAGEVCTSPDEGTTNGTLVIDKMGKFENIKAIIKDGYVQELENCNELEEMLEELGKDAKNIAELGIGTNPKAKLTGNVLEDEKIFGTVHVAFGNNVSFGGKVDVPLHKDGIVLKPTLEADGEIIIKDGKWMI